MAAAIAGEGPSSLPRCTVPHRSVPPAGRILFPVGRRRPKNQPAYEASVACGIPRMAQKLAEEATEVVIEAVRGDRSAVINVSVDLIYNLTVLWSELGITAAEI
jgi:phosphoribosyl-ATP pyrophosphohydrolase